MILRMFIAAALLSLSACGSNGSTDKLSGVGQAAQADLDPKSGSDVAGHVTFREEDGVVRVTATINGLTPGAHGFHVHENGDCSAADATSAGGHFNPRDNPHGSPERPRDQHHAGDLGNLTADQTGKASYDQRFDHLQMSGAESIIGRAVVVHGGEDDLRSQPAGDAGNRVACGVIATVD